MPIKKLPLTWMRTLQDESNSGVKAASGLVKVGNTFYVIADDEVSLAIYNFADRVPARYIQLLPTKLATDPIERKKQKPDWESLVQLQIDNDNQVLLAVPSGSTANRMIGVWIGKDNKPMAVDFSEIYSALKLKFSDLNIEGACVVNDRLKLFQRGNGANGKNAVIDIDLAGFCSDLKKSKAIHSQNILDIRTYDLGTLSGIKLDFTDACAVHDTIWFLAVAEDSKSTYEDGKYYGAILGCLDSAGNEVARYEIDCATKPEGLWVEAENHRLSFYVVTDADNPIVFASIYYGKLLLN